MPSKIQLDENLWFLYICLQKSDMKAIDFNAVAKETSLRPPAARMRYTRLRKQIESGTLIGTHGVPFASEVEDRKRRRMVNAHGGRNTDDNIVRDGNAETKRENGDGDTKRKSEAYSSADGEFENVPEEENMHVSNARNQGDESEDEIPLAKLRRGKSKSASRTSPTQSMVKPDPAAGRAGQEAEESITVNPIVTVAGSNTTSPAPRPAQSPPLASEATAQLAHPAPEQRYTVAAQAQAPTQYQNQHQQHQGLNPTQRTAPPMPNLIHPVMQFGMGNPQMYPQHPNTQSQIYQSPYPPPNRNSGPVLNPYAYGSAVGQRHGERGWDAYAQQERGYSQQEEEYLRAMNWHLEGAL